MHSGSGGMRLCQPAEAAVEIAVMLRRPGHHEIDECALCQQGAEGEVAGAGLLLVEWEKRDSFPGLHHHDNAGPDAGDAGDARGKAGLGAELDDLVEDGRRDIARGEHEGLACEIAKIDGTWSHGMSLGNNGDDRILVKKLGDELRPELGFDSAGKTNIDFAVDEGLPLAGRGHLDQGDTHSGVLLAEGADEPGEVDADASGEEADFEGTDLTSLSPASGFHGVVCVRQDSPRLGEEEFSDRSEAGLS